MHDRAGSEADVLAALTAFEYAGPRPKPPRLADNTARRAFEAFWPPDSLQMAGAGRLIGEELLEFQQGAWVV